MKNYKKIYIKPQKEQKSYSVLFVCHQSTKECWYFHFAEKRIKEGSQDRNLDPLIKISMFYFLINRRVKEPVLRT